MPRCTGASGSFQAGTNVTGVFTAHATGRGHALVARCRAAHVKR
ncbi:hypothetical protein [Streptomyces sp. NBC_00273]|nr:hypothetical protein [Streptomyces sp. NBC_00273]